MADAKISTRKFQYYRQALAEDLRRDGRPRIDDVDLLLEALIRAHGTAGRADIAPEIELARRLRRHAGGSDV